MHLWHKILTNRQLLTHAFCDRVRIRLYVMIKHKGEAKNRHKENQDGNCTNWVGQQLTAANRVQQKYHHRENQSTLFSARRQQGNTSMRKMRDVEEGWTLAVPDERLTPYSQRDVVESGPEVGNLHNRNKTTYRPVVLSVKFAANHPVTITWKVDGNILETITDCCRWSRTELELSSLWLQRHLDNNYEVTILDQEMNERNGINPVRTSCKVCIN